LGVPNIAGMLRPPLIQKLSDRFGDYVLVITCRQCKHGRRTEPHALAKLLGWDAAKQTGTFVGGDNPWGDPAKGEQLAKTFIDQGADIVAPVAGGTGNGSIKAMLAAKGYAIGVDTDQSLSLPEYAAALLTSAQKVIDVAALDTFKKNAGGDLGGENYVGTLANGGVGIAPFHDLDSVVPAEVKTEVDQLKADIASGAVKVSDYLK